MNDGLIVAYKDTILRITGDSWKAIVGVDGFTVTDVLNKTILTVNNRVEFAGYNSNDLASLLSNLPVILRDWVKMHESLGEEDISSESKPQIQGKDISGILGNKE